MATAPRKQPAPAAPAPKAPEPVFIDWAAVGRNVQYTVQDGYLTISVQIDASAVSGAVKSGTGKSMVLASTGGYHWVKGIIPGKDIGLSLNTIYTDAK